MKPLHIALNLTWLAPGRVGGSETYLMRQIAGLVAGGGRGEPALELSVYCHRALVGEYRDLLDGITTVTMPTRHDRRGTRIFFEHTWLAAKTRDADVVHHGGGTQPLIGNPTTVATIHDLQYLKFPHFFSTGRRRYLSLMVPQTARRATVIVTPTEYVRSTVIDAFGVDPTRVRAVPHGVPSLTRPDDETILACQQRFGIRQPYLVYPAITHPHKGHATLIAMLQQAPKLYGLDGFQLVFLGGRGDAESEVTAAVDAANLGERIIRTGRVSDVDRDSLLAGASALVFPSKYEGFGAPLVEAMDLGVPVIASAHPAITEVVGGAGILVDSDEPEAWADAVQRAIAAPQPLIDAGVERRREFLPANSAYHLGNAYRLAAQRSQHRDPRR